MTACCHCQRILHSRLRRGLCKTCYEYQRTHGIPRPLSRRAGLCENCQKNRAGDASHTLCNACYIYQKRNGKRRPSYLWAECCKVCGKPRQEGRRAATKGRCHSCYAYRWRYGVDRPKHLVQAIAPLGWCECGKPASKIVTLRFGGVDMRARRKYDYPLCTDCAKEEEKARC